MGNGTEAAQSREMAPALGGQPTTQDDPPILHQFTSEINQATEFLRIQTQRLRMHTDSMCGAEVENEGKAEEGLDHVRPTIEELATAIRDLHNGTSKLSAQLDRLERHKLT